MNKYIYNSVAEITGLLKCTLLKIERRARFKSSLINLISPNTEITVDRGGKLSIGRILKMRKGSVLRVRKEAKVSIGKKLSISNNCMIVSHELIQIGDNSVIGAGTIIKGKIPSDTLVYQKRNTELKQIRMNFYDKNITSNR